MSDLISRQAVLKLLSAMPSEEAITKAMLIQSVQQMDAAQPEIIHCRDCKHWIDNDGFNHDKGAECEVMRMWMQPGDYCSYSKRREVSE